MNPGPPSQFVALRRCRETRRQQEAGTHKMVAVVDLDRDHPVVGSVPEEAKDSVIT